jgi:pimeloyl-ACP methyl ester carboxylesterase
MWADHLAPLADAGYRAVALDLPGFGDASAVSDAPWKDVIETLDELGIERAVFVGNSFGGAVALIIAVVAPERVSGLVVISAPPPDLEPSPELAAIWEAEGEALDRGDVDAAVAAAVDAWTLPGAPAELREQVGTMYRRATELQLAADDGSKEIEDPLEQQPDALSQIAVPALVAAGEHDKVDFRDGAERIAAALPEATHIVIEDAGHLAPLETPNRFRDLLLAFLAT